MLIQMLETYGRQRANRLAVTWTDRIQINALSIAKCCFTLTLNIGTTGRVKVYSHCTGPGMGLERDKEQD